LIADYLTAAGGSGGTYRWTPGITVGDYEVFAWWVADRRGTSDVPVTIAQNDNVNYFSHIVEGGGPGLFTL
jgi:hypothetical protein